MERDTDADPAGDDPLRAMVDIETYGLAPGAPVVAVAVVLFRREEIVDERHWAVSADSSVAAGLDADDEATREWWAEQSAAAREHVDGDADLRTALDGLRDALAGAEEVWAKAPKFDASHLEAAYEAVGEEAPWNYYDLRDVRTLVAVADVPDEEVAGTAHHALDDARHQVRQVQAALRAVESGNGD